MIGLFGLYRAEVEAPADLASMAATVPAGYDVCAPAAKGAAIGRVAHDADGGGIRATPNGRLSAAAVGEIFNIDELVDGDADARPGDVAALVLRLAESGRLDRLARANGLFCAALYDRGNHRLTLITDRLASFPLHVWRNGREVAFAGQIHTLLGHGRVPRKAEPKALAQLFTMQRTIGRITSVAGVEALPAACIFEVDRDGIRERLYWEVAWRRPDFGVAEGAERLAAAFRRALTRQAAGEDNALLLSGGVDSRLVLAAAPSGALSCWTTASYADNPELKLAREAAAHFGADHHPLVVEPADTLTVLERTVIESNGLYPASTPMSVFLPNVGAESRVILTGHGIDYTLRGYYLPARFAEIGGSRTRLPKLRPIAARPTGADVLANLRQGPPRATLERIAAKGVERDWWRWQEKAMDDVLAPWLSSDEPVNAWDAFILHAVSKHYAFTGMMAVRAAADLRLPAFDNEIFDIYLATPPAWRCSGRMVQLALRHLSPAAAAMPNANTHFRADLTPWLEVAGLLGRGALRRIGLARRHRLPSSFHSAGSWQDSGNLYRDDPRHRARFTEIRGRLDGLGLGVLDPDGLAACVDEHLEGRAKHTKLLRQLLTHDAWVRTFGIEGSA